MSPFPMTRVLVAVDFSSASARAVQFAGDLAERAGAALVAVHAEAIEVPPYFTRDQIDTLQAQLKAARQRAVDEIRRLIAAHTAARAEVVVTDGPPVDAILGAAAGVDLVVVGTHGRRGPARWWLGSVAERVVREATMPVLVVPGPDTTDERPAAGPVLLTAAETPAAHARQWARYLGDLTGVVVAERPGLARQQAADVTGASLIVVPVPPREGFRAVHDASVALTQTCQRPVLFVPERA